MGYVTTLVNTVDSEEEDDDTKQEDIKTEKVKKKRPKKSWKKVGLKKFDHSHDDLRTQAQKLTAVQEDPSLLLALDDYIDVVNISKKQRGRPKKVKGIPQNKAKKRTPSKQNGEDMETPKKKGKGQGKKSKSAQ